MSGDPASPGSASAPASPSCTSRSRLPPQLFEHDGIDCLDAVHSLFEIRVSRPAEQGVGQLSFVADSRQALAELAAELVVDRNPLVPRGLSEDRLVQAVDAA